MKYERMLPHEIDRVISRRPIAIIPWGALEWHGYHLAVGQDGLKASSIADRVADLLQVVSLPPIYCGYQTMKPHRGFRHCIEISQSTVAGLVRDFVGQLADEGFKVIVIITGHYGPRHVETLKFNAIQVGKEVGTKVWVLPEYEPVADLDYRGDHAAKWETSIFLHLFPELVHMHRYNSDLSMADQGVSGEDPSTTASREVGEQIVNTIVERVANRSLELLSEAEKEQLTYKPWRAEGMR